MGRVIHWERCKIFKFVHTKKWYMHNPAPVQENDTHINSNGTYKWITRPYDNQQKKRTCKIVDFAVPADHWIKLKEVKRKISTWTLLGNWKKYGTWRWQWYQSWLVLLVHHQRIIKGTGGLGGRRTNGDHANYKLLRTVRIQRRVLETWGDLLSLKLQWKATS